MFTIIIVAIVLVPFLLFLLSLFWIKVPKPQPIPLVEIEVDDGSVPMMRNKKGVPADTCWMELNNMTVEYSTYSLASTNSDIIASLQTYQTLYDVPSHYSCTFASQIAAFSSIIAKKVSIYVVNPVLLECAKIVLATEIMVNDTPLQMPIYLDRKILLWKICPWSPNIFLEHPALLPSLSSLTKQLYDDLTNMFIECDVTPVPVFLLPMIEGLLNTLVQVYHTYDLDPNIPPTIYHPDDGTKTCPSVVPWSNYHEGLYGRPESGFTHFTIWPGFGHPQLKGLLNASTVWLKHWHFDAIRGLRRRTSNQ